jgi:hypothetical protein
LLFALEEWGDPLGMFMQALPGLILLIISLFSFRSSLFGAISFLVLSIFVLFFYSQDVLLYLFTPLILVSVLYFVDYHRRNH